MDMATLLGWICGAVAVVFGAVVVWIIVSALRPAKLSEFGDLDRMSTSPHGAIESLSPAQQKALFSPPRHLEMLAKYKLADAGVLGVASPLTDGGIIKTEPFSSDVAAWALAYAQRIQAGGALFRGGRIQEALAEFMSIHQDLPTAAIVLMNIGVCHGELGDEGAARSWLERSQRFVPTEFAHQVHSNLSRL
jgi:hypothetical protein